MNQYDSKCESMGCDKKDTCSGSCEAAAAENDFSVKAHEKNSIKKVIGVVSGKGGVGKSLVTSTLAVLTRRRGYSVGVLDADITGPSIPKMFGISNRALASKEGIIPERTHNDIKIMSINLLLDEEDAPVVWRGPLVSSVVKQFWTDVVWEDVDYLFIDMPPGTSDVVLTVFQSIPLDGIVVVTTPQDLVHMIVRKAYNMAKSMRVPVLGIVENMSYVKCPHCDEEIKVFGDSHIEEIAKGLDIEVLGRMPIDPALAEAS
ncbi:P-loop NTPase, partial [Lutispora sp.]|uniref:P-loop NTPase n=1 Tax=Lutispora sp. TaxID=2828727 RepID=UPI0035639953